MKKRKYIVIFIGIIFALLLIIGIKEYKNNDTESVFKVILSTDEFCTDKEEFYVQLEDDNVSREIYTICISDILVNYENSAYSLKSVLEGVSVAGIGGDLEADYSISLEELYDMANEEIKYKDGGSVQYIYDNFFITKCNSIDGRKDILISNTLIDIDVCYQ